MIKTNVDIKFKELKCHNKETFLKYYDQYKSIVFSAILLYCSDSNLYNDIASDALFVLYKSLENYKSSKGAITSYIYEVVKHMSWRYLKKEKAHRNIEKDYETKTKIEEQTHKIFKFSSLKNILTEEEYQLIFNHYVLTKKLSVIAREMGISYNQAKYLHKLILKRIRPFLEETIL